MKDHAHHVTLLKQSKELIALFTYLRDKETNRSDFIYFADRIIRLLIEEGMFNYISFTLFVCFTVLIGVSMILMEPVSIETLTGEARKRTWRLYIKFKTPLFYY